MTQTNTDWIEKHVKEIEIDESLMRYVERDDIADHLVSQSADLVDKLLHEEMMVDGKDDGLDGYFQSVGFRLVAPNTIKECHGYSFAEKADIVNDIAYINLPQEKKDLIPDETIFVLSGILKTGEITVTHWLPESSKFAQRVACDWWDNAEGEVYYELEKKHNIKIVDSIDDV